MNQFDSLSPLGIGVSSAFDQGILPDRGMHEPVFKKGSSYAHRKGQAWEASDDFRQYGDVDAGVRNAFEDVMQNFPDVPVSEFSEKNDAPQFDDAVMLPGESQDEHLERKSLIRAVKKENLECYEREVGNFKAGTKEYERSLKDYKKKALERVNQVILNGDKEKLPDAVVLGMVWFEKLADQFFDMNHRYGNLDSFGNMIAIFHDAQYFMYNFGKYASFSKLMDCTYKSGLKWDPKQRPAIILAGDKSCGKSYIMAAFEDQLPPGIGANVTHQTSLARTGGGMNDLKVDLTEEGAPEVIGGGVGSRNKDIENSRGTAILKAMLTNKVVQTNSLQIEKGIRRLVKHCSSNIGTQIIATNLQLSEESNPTIARFIVLMVENDPDMDKRISQLEDFELKGKKKDELGRRKLITFYVMLAEIYIFTGVIRDVQMDGYTMYLQLYKANMEKRGFFMKEPKNIVHLREIARTLTVEYAVSMALFSEVTYKKRTSLIGDGYVRFFDHCDFFVGLIESFLVTTRSISIYAFSLCKMLWANPLESVVLDSARKHTIANSMHIFDAACFLDGNNEPQEGGALESEEFDLSCSEAHFEQADGRPLNPQEISSIEADRLQKIVPIEQDGDDDDEDIGLDLEELLSNATLESERMCQPLSGWSRDVSNDSHEPVHIPFRVTYKGGEHAAVVCPNYVEVKPSGGFSVHNVANTLLQYCGEARPSQKNLSTVLKSLSQQEIVCPVYAFDASEKKVVKTANNTRVSVVRIQRNTPLLDPHMTEGSGMRVFVSLHALLNRHSIDRACMASIRDLGFDNSIPGRFIVNITMVCPENKRGRRGTRRKMVTMHGIQNTVTVMPNPDHVWVFERSKVYTKRMDDVMSNQRRGYDPSESEAPSHLSEAALRIDAEPENIAIMRHFLNAGVPRGDLGLFTAPIILQKRIARIRMGVPQLSVQRMYDYPRSVIADRYAAFLQSATSKSKDPVLLRRLQPISAIAASMKTKSDAMPAECIATMSPYQIRNMLFAQKDPFASAVQKGLEKDPLAMLRHILEKKYADPERMLRNLVQAGVDINNLMDINAFREQKNSAHSIRIKRGNMVGMMMHTMYSEEFSAKKRRVEGGLPDFDQGGESIDVDQPLREHAIGMDESMSEFEQSVRIAEDSRDSLVPTICTGESREVDDGIDRLMRSQYMTEHESTEEHIVRANELDEIGERTGAYMQGFVGVDVGPRTAYRESAQSIYQKLQESREH